MHLPNAHRPSGPAAVLRLLICLLILLVIAACGDGDAAGDGADAPPAAGAEDAGAAPGPIVEDLVAGEGAAARADDLLAVRHTTWIWRDGSRSREVDASGEEPDRFLLGRGEVMPGWDEGLVGLQVGGTRRLTMPPELVGRAHRPRGTASDDSLVSEVTLEDLARIEVADLVAGEGPAIQQGDFVVFHHEGWLLEDGQKGERFVSSREDGEPTGVMVGAGMVNRGLDLGLEGLRVGGKRQVTVPPALAYGDRGQGPVPPDATVLYEVEAVRIPQLAAQTLREGEGDPAGPGQRVRVHLTGWVANPDSTKGEKFQDTREMGSPHDLILGGFKIQPGLEVGLRGMRAGELRRLYVPAAMAFGRAGYKRAHLVLVPPDADVIYEVELLEAPRTTR